MLHPHTSPRSYPRTINRKFFLEAKGRIHCYKKLLLGTAELADVLGIPRQSLCNWRVRFNFIPLPAAELSQGPTWERARIWQWIAWELDSMGSGSVIPQLLNKINEGH